MARAGVRRNEIEFWRSDQGEKTMKALRLVPVIVLALSGVLVGAGTASAEPPPHHGYSHPYNCTGGNVPPGTYNSMVITGVCYMPAGTVAVRGNLTVAPGALLDATTAGDPSATPLAPATVYVGGNVSVGAGAVLFLGCSPNIGCPMAVSYDRIGGNLTANGALGVVVHSTDVEGDFSLHGGGGGTSCTTIPPLWLSDPSLANGEGPGVPVPVYSDSEDDVIGGRSQCFRSAVCWIGSLRTTRSAGTPPRSATPWVTPTPWRSTRT